jgi:protease-4
MQMIRDSFDWFVSLVAERRRLPIERVRLLADGRVYTGRQALQEKLIDGIGGEDAAVQWLATVKKIPQGMQIIDWKADEGFGPSGLGFAAFRGFLRVLGMDRWAQTLERMWRGTAVQLDGLQSVWHPDSQ